MTIDLALHQKMSAAISVLSMDAVEKANSGHPGMPMGMADVATVLFTRHLIFNPSDPTWPDRDRFVLSAGHGSMLIYSLLYLLGVEDMPLEELKKFRQIGAKTAGHPEYGHVAGIETTTGPLGQGISNAVGMAMAEAHLNARFGESLVDHHTYVVAGDGCLMEGISQEAISMAGHYKLRKLIVLWDDNNITIDGSVSLSDSTDQRARFEASGWHTISCDGHDAEDIDRAIVEAKKQDRPTLIACKTVIGKGADQKAGTSKAHGAPLGQAEIDHARKALNWPYAPFEIPDDVLGAWREAGARHAKAYHAWQDRLNESSSKPQFEECQRRDVQEAVMALEAHAMRMLEEKPSLATRKASQNALEVLNEALPFTMGGSADLTGSNNTLTDGMTPFTCENYAGRYVYYGIREHGMAAAMNGMAVHGGIVPYGGIFLVFADYARPSIRLSALMGLPVIYVMTHDSIGLGEDGPTHQPVEHLASLRAIPNVTVFRPADAAETSDSWAAVLNKTDGPSVLALTRQSLPTLEREPVKENRVARGGYVLGECASAVITIIASGSEVEIAVDAAARLSGQGITARIVSMPSLDLFLAQDDDYQQNVLGSAPRLVLEAGIRQGWDRILYAYGGHGEFMGVESFGLSAPYKEVYQHFGLTAAEAATRAMSMIERNS